MAEMTSGQPWIYSSKLKKCSEVGEGLFVTFPSFAAHGFAQVRNTFFLISWLCYKGVMRDAVAYRLDLAQQLEASCIHEKICTGDLCTTKLSWDFSGDNVKSSNPEEKLEFQSMLH